MQKGERNIDRQLLNITQLSPEFFIIRFDRGIIFSQCEFETAISIDVTVGNMMNHLMNSPSSITVRSLQLLFIQIQNSVFQLQRKEFYIGHPFYFLRNGKWLGF